MNESIGNALLFNLVITFVIVLSGLFIGSMAYTKAFKVKNKIIEEIEKQGENSSTPETAYADAQDEIYDWLSSSGEKGRGIGYKKNLNSSQQIFCPQYKGVDAINKTGDYEYCVYFIDTCNNGGDSDKCGKYYHVTTYMYFDVPIIGSTLKFPISGSTKVIYNLGDK